MAKTPTTKETSLPIDVNGLKAGALELRAVNNKLRQQIIKTIHAKGFINVTTLYKKLKIEQSVASQHLRILRDARFVTTARFGKKIRYAINHKRFAQVDNLIKDVVGKTK
jgi:DNA-binding transcriptional ArsR family regulator